VLRGATFPALRLGFLYGMQDSRAGFEVHGLRSEEGRCWIRHLPDRPLRCPFLWWKTVV